MARRRKAMGADPGSVPIPLEAVDLLAGLAPGLELCADDVPIAPAVDPAPASVTVADTGRLLRSGDATIRRLIRSELLAPAPGGRRRRERERERAGVVPRTRLRPGE